MAELSAQDLAQFEVSLDTLEQELRETLTLAEEGSRPVELDLPIGRLSRMDAMQQQSMAEAGRQAARARLDQVRAARERLRAGRYGECLECEESIAVARLRARPEAPLCLACQSGQETSRR